LTLRIGGVSKTLSTFAIKNVSLEVGKGEYFVLLGPTGAGKTLLLELIMGFHHPDKGKIVLNGQDVTEVPTEKRGLGYVPQNCPLFPHMSVYENVEFGLRMQRKGLEERRKSVQIALELVGLRGMEERKSRGMGMACFVHVSSNRGIHPIFDGSSAITMMDEHGKVKVISGEGEIGQGANTVFAQITSEELGIPLKEFIRIALLSMQGIATDLGL